MPVAIKSLSEYVADSWVEVGDRLHKQYDAHWSIRACVFDLTDGYQSH